MEDRSNTATLHGYVARDEDGALHLFEVEPARLEYRWWDVYYISCSLDNEDFPNLKWEDEPIHVKITITEEE